MPRGGRSSGPWALGLLLAVIAGCGFQLRGSGGNAALPPGLSTLRIASAGVSTSDPLTAEVREAFRRSGAHLVSTGDVPTLVLLGEHIDSQVGSVRATTGKASEYVLRYTASFRLDGPQPLAAQEVRLQRDYSFNPEQVLAKEQEERELLVAMRREAAQQIVRRVSRALGDRGQ